VFEGSGERKHSSSVEECGGRCHPCSRKSGIMVPVLFASGFCRPRGRELRQASEARLDRRCLAAGTQVTDTHDRRFISGKSLLAPPQSSPVSGRELMIIYRLRHRASSRHPQYSRRKSDMSQ